MRSLALLLATFTWLAIEWPAYALPAVRPVLPPVANADTETVTNVAFVAWEQGLREFRFDLAFTGTASNNVEMAFGTDADGNGELSDGEVAVRTGWDCGELFIADNATGERFTEASTAGAHVFSCVCEMRSSGRVVNVACTDNGAAVFLDLAAAKPAWLHSLDWNMVRLTGRGENVRVLRELFDPRNDIPADSALLAPLRARLGIVPLLNWNLAEGLESRFWASSTPSNTLLLTWQKVLLGRSPEKPISFQVELTPGGRFRFAYDLVSANGTDLSTNVLAGAFCGDCRVTVAPPPGVVSVFDFNVENPVDTDGDGLNDGWERAYSFSPLVDNATDNDPANDYGYDRDNDGLTNGQECEWGTNPRSEDTDNDGVTEGLAQGAVVRRHHRGGDAPDRLHAQRPPASVPQLAHAQRGVCGTPPPAHAFRRMAARSLTLPALGGRAASPKDEVSG